MGDQKVVTKQARRRMLASVAAVVVALLMALLFALLSGANNATSPSSDSALTPPAESASPSAEVMPWDMQGLELWLPPNWMPEPNSEFAAQSQTTMVDHASCADPVHTDCSRLTVIDLNTYESLQGRPYGPSEGEECYQYNPALDGTWYGGEEKVEETTIAGLPAVHFTYVACELDELTMSSSLPDMPDPSTAMDLWLIDGRYAVIEFKVELEVMEAFLEGARVTE